MFKTQYKVPTLKKKKMFNYNNKNKLATMCSGRMC